MRGFHLLAIAKTSTPQPPLAITKFFAVIGGQTRCSFASAPSASCFSSLRDFSRARLFYSRKFTFSPQAECFRHIGGACKKCDFCARFRLLIHFVHENLGELTPAIFRDSRTNPMFARFRGLGIVFSSLRKTKALIPRGYKGLYSKYKQFDL